MRDVQLATTSGLFSELRDPAFEEPCGCGGGGRGFSGAAGEFDGIVHGGVVGHAVEETDLIEAYANGEPDGFVESGGGTFGIFVD
jgi:hypothetical protein